MAGHMNDNTKQTVLVCDDEKDIANAISLFLKSEGYDVKTASNGKEAIEILESEEIHLVLMDIMMPGKNGIEAARDIRRLGVEDALTVPIIALTADASEDTDEKCLRAGMNAALKKPVENEILFYTLAKEFEKSVRREGQASL